MANVKISDLSVAGSANTGMQIEVNDAGSSKSVTVGNIHDAHPAATVASTGVVQLSTSTGSTSTVLAATPSAVKSAYDLANTANTTANAALPKAGGTMTGQLTLATGGSGNQAITVTEAGALAGAAAAASVPRTSWFDGVGVEAPKVAEYDFARSLPADRAIATIRHVCTAGTATVELKDNGGVLATLSVTTSAATSSISHTVATGERLYLNVTAVSSCEGLEVWFGGA